MMMPLEDVKVLDLSHALAGPFCSTMLGDFGADVVKVEPPGSGDISRAWGPPFYGTETAYFVGLHRNKKSIEIDLKHPDGRELYFRLMEKAATNRARNANRATLIDRLQEIFLTKTYEAWEAILLPHGIPMGAINTIDQVVEHPQVASRGMIVETDHPTAGKVKMVGVPVKLSATPGAVRQAAPLLGQHTDDVLRSWLGLDDREIADLRQSGAIGSPARRADVEAILGPPRLARNRGAPRLRRGAPRVGGVWGAILGPPTY